MLAVFLCDMVASRPRTVVHIEADTIGISPFDGEYREVTEQKTISYESLGKADSEDLSVTMGERGTCISIGTPEALRNEDSDQVISLSIATSKSRGTWPAEVKAKTFFDEKEPKLKIEFSPPREVEK